MEVYVLGTRGFPGIQGGVEKHCESLYPLIASKNFEIKVFRRRPYLTEGSIIHYQNITFQDLWCPKNKYLETISHSFIASLVCLLKRPDLVHIHNIGPSLVLPLLRLVKLKTIVTYHSSNYEHEKWGWFARKILKIGEFFVGKLADKVIFVSEGKSREVKCRSKVFIPNGVICFPKNNSVDFLYKKGIHPGRYILAVARFTPEKGLHDLINAFRELKNNCQLVIAGDADHETDYSKKLNEIAAQDERIILTGYIIGDPLNQIFSNASLFCLPSHNEGHPIALLEAMSYGLPVLASDIPANREVNLRPERYFKCGDINELRKKLALLLEEGLPDEEMKEYRRQIVDKYNWSKIAEQTVNIYEKVLQKGD